MIVTGKIMCAGATCIPGGTHDRQSFIRGAPPRSSTTYPFIYHFLTEILSYTLF